MNTHRPTAGHRRRHLLAALAAALLLALTGCGGSAGTDTATSGELRVAMKDAEGDFLTYTVDVTSLRLTKASGAVVETLPRTTTVDFAQYVEVSELVTVQSVPTGHYVQAQVTLDFSNALITVQSPDGEALTATAVDALGEPLDQVTVTLDLNGDSGVTIVRGVPALFVLDFDLEASNEISISGDAATVTVAPVLVAEAELEAGDEFRLRGQLESVASDSFRLDLRPFHLRDGAFGEAEVQVDAGTVIEIDGIAYDAVAGMTLLASLDPGTPVITLGSFDTASRRYTASQVYAGSSVPWAGQDVVVGSVIARDGDILSVRGATVVRADGSVVFHDDVSVALDATTQVSRQGSTAPATLADVSVGSAVSVAGVLGQTGTLNAAGGHLRLRQSVLTGNVAAAGPLALDLQTVNARRVGLYDFSGTGVDAANDADRDFYEIATGSLSLSGLELGDPVRVRGFVRPFGLAPEDFSAVTIVDVQALPALLVVGYGPLGSDTAVAAWTETSLQLDLTGVGGRHHLVQGGVATDLTGLAGAPVLVAPEDGAGVYAIAQGSRVAVYGDFAAWAGALAEELGAGGRVWAVHARGGFDADLNTLTARAARVRLVR